ncbi:recombinase family protein [Neobacillus drentensis]|uniref:recombinase family protein n=1 Tax=Neobacillus drentensis TaxID=220684 RepID=UPI00285DBD85|nr:recombinase family protein [Neobacillus drentensis]MDR7237317.1 DNA invertase Pin-like site-specific DNA recombinase [Neobacillus drentensis]
MRIGYARVSKTEQNLDLQLDTLKKAGAEEIFHEKMSGKRDDRPELNRLLQYLRKGDSLVIYKLDRLGRSTKKLLELAEELDSRGIELISTQDQIDTSTAIGKAMFRMLMVLAEMERDITAERTIAGLEAARARGRVGGRPKKEKKAVEKAVKLYHSKEYTVSEITEMTGVSKASLYRTLKIAT